MSSALLQQLHILVDNQDWAAILDLKDEIEAMRGSNRDRALALHILGRAYWNVGKDAFHLAESIRYARKALQLDHLQGRVLKSLGTRLVTVGWFHEGSRLLLHWLEHFDRWAPDVQDRLAEVQYTLGYAARYQRDFARAARWYEAALSTYRMTGNQVWVALTSSALAQVEARRGNPLKAREILWGVHWPPSLEAYRLKALVEILVAEGNHEDALSTGDAASEALVELEDGDPWELAELHVLLADVEARRGNLTERDKHLELALYAMHMSPRHDLYAIVCLLLDQDGKEVVA